MRALTLQLPAFSATGSVWAEGFLDGVLDQDCALCAAASPRLVCDACESALPRPRASCVRCAIALPAGEVCGECRRHPPQFDETVAAFEYRFPIDRLVQRFKYAGDLALGRWLAEQLATRLAGVDPPTLVVAPPSSPERLRERGFNPGLEIAKTVAGRLRLSRSIDAVSRARKTAPQPGLGRKARRRNLEGVFDCRLPLEGSHVAIVDDVLTTGATADAVAAVLRKAGAARVSVWVVARTPEPRS